MEATTEKGTALTMRRMIFVAHTPPEEFNTAEEAFEALGRWHARMGSPKVKAWDTRVVRVITPTEATREEVDPRR